MTEENPKKVEGKAKGVVARASKLSPERRSEIARQTALARHKPNKLLIAIRRGNFKDDFNLDTATVRTF